MLAVVMNLLGVSFVVLPVVLVVCTWTAVHHARPGGPEPAPEPDRWEGAVTGFDRIRRAYAAYECDPAAVLARPVLADVTHPETARFVERFASAQALYTETRPPSGHARLFADAVVAVTRAWERANEAADLVGTAGLGARDRRRVERVLRLLYLAQVSDHEPERRLAHARAVQHLRRHLGDDPGGRRFRMPRAAVAALETAPPPRAPAEG